MKEVQTYSTAEDRLYTDVRTIIEEARLNAIRSVDFSRVVMYWKTGRRVFEEEQNGADRADYGTYLIERLASRLEPSYGSGFSKRQIERARQFYRTYPNVSALRPQFNWTHYWGRVRRFFCLMELGNSNFPFLFLEEVLNANH